MQQLPEDTIRYKENQTIDATDHNLEDIMVAHLRAVITAGGTWYAHDVIEWNVSAALSQVTAPITRILDDLQ